MNWRPRLRTVLLGVSLAAFLIPLVGIVGLRVYQSELIRRTEAELISQGALIQAIYKEKLKKNLREHPVDLNEYGKPVKIDWPRKVNTWLKPIPEKLQLTTGEIYPPLKAAKSNQKKMHPAVRKTGKQIRSILLDSQTITLSGTHLVNPKGKVVSSTHSIVGETIRHFPEIKKALEGQFIQRLRRRDVESDPPLDSISRGTDLKVTVAMPIVEGQNLVGAVMLLRTPMSLKKALYRHRYPIGIAIGLMLIGVIGISLLTSYFISQPIERLVRQTEKIKENKGGAESIENPRTVEIEELSTALSKMAQTIRERTEYIESFARNVSHEFKSPLSSIQGTVELLDEHYESMDTEKRKAFLDNLKQDGQRLEKLLNRLLTLARADTLKPGDESIELSENLENLASKFDTETFTVAYQLAEDNLPELAISDEAFESVMANLIKNADENGASRIDITVEKTEGTSVTDAVDIFVKDDGLGISKANANKIFDSFFTTDEHGTGLGLSIVESLLEAHDATIELVDFKEETTFRIRIPTN